MIYKSGIIILIASILTYPMYSYVVTGAPTYTTWDGLEPDKWASVWLIKKQISPDSKIDIRAIHSRTDDGIAFDVPGAKFYRNSERSTYASLLNEYRSRVAIDDPAILRLGEIIQDMDVNVWASKALPETAILENAIRTLQQNYDRTSVPPECYIALFDDAYLLLSTQSEFSDARLNKVVHSCNELNLSGSVTRTSSIVTEIPVNEVLRQIDEGKNVIFIDTRELEEFNEMHIPGALNIKLRDVSQQAVENLKNADLVISYCVKDFRGYEVARAIRELGIENSSIMMPYGIRGWNDLGLPVFSKSGMSEFEAQKKLKECASNRNSCLDAVL